MKKKSNIVLPTVIIWIMAVIFMAPLYLDFINSFKTKGEIMESALSFPQHWSLENYQIIITDSDFISSFFFSLLVTVVTTSLTVLIAAITGYALARWQSRLSKILMLTIMSTLFVPFQVYMVALIVVVRSIKLVNNPVGLILIYISLGMPVPIFLCRSYVIGMSKDIEEAAMIDGCSRWKMIFLIVLPLMKPILATTAVLNALWVWGEFLVAFLVYGNGKPNTLPVSQRYFFGDYTNQWNLILANFMISSIPIILFYIFMQKYIVKGIAAGAVKG